MGKVIAYYWKLYLSVSDTQWQGKIFKSSSQWKRTKISFNLFKQKKSDVNKPGTFSLIDILGVIKKYQDWSLYLLNKNLKFKWRYLYSCATNVIKECGQDAKTAI